MFGATAVRQKREREKRDKIARGLKVTGSNMLRLSQHGATSNDKCFHYMKK